MESEIAIDQFMSFSLSFVIRFGFQYISIMKSFIIIIIIIILTSMTNMRTDNGY